MANGINSASASNPNPETTIPLDDFRIGEMSEKDVVTKYAQGLGVNPQALTADQRRSAVEAYYGKLELPTEIPDMILVIPTDTKKRLQEYDARWCWVTEDKIQQYRGKGYEVVEHKGGRITGGVHQVHILMAIRGSLWEAHEAKHAQDTQDRMEPVIRDDEVRRHQLDERDLPNHRPLGSRKYSGLTEGEQGSLDRSIPGGGGDIENQIAEKRGPARPRGR